MRRLAEKTVRVVTLMPEGLFQRLLRQVGKETIDRGCRMTASQVVRYAVEEYLDAWETATFVRAAEAAPVAGGKDQ